MPTNDSEQQFETILVTNFRNMHQYEEGVSDDFNKNYALYKERVKRFILSTQNHKVDNTAYYAIEIAERYFFLN